MPIPHYRVYLHPAPVLTAAKLDTLVDAVTDPANFATDGSRPPNPLVKLVGRLAVEVKALRAERDELRRALTAARTTEA